MTRRFTIPIMIAASAIVMFISSCGILDADKQRAIEVCQSSKVQFGTGNILEFLGLKLLGWDDKTWLDFANYLAKTNPNETYAWTAERTDEDGIYIVAFADELGWGQRWQVAVDAEVVKHINSNEYLSRKYGFSRFSGSEEFKVASVQLDTLRLMYSSQSSEPTIIYEFEGTVLNNTENVITDADITGRLKVIFEEKTVEGESSYRDGFRDPISKASPWRPGEERKFKLTTDGIEGLYAEYDPPFALFEIELKAEDPIGYKYDENIEEIDLVKKWNALVQ